MADAHSIPTISVEHPTPPAGPRRLPSTDDGRFMIIDETSKDSDSFDETASSDNDSVDQEDQFSKSYISSRQLPHMNFPVQLPKLSFNSSATRFKIVPVETRYKRGRWASWDYYDNNSLQLKRVLPVKDVNQASSPPQTPTPAFESSFHLTPQSSKRVTSRPHTAPLATPDPMSPLTFEFSDGDSDGENLVLEGFEQNEMTIDLTSAMTNEAKDRVNDLVNLRENLQNRPQLTPPETLSLSGRITPSEMLHQYGLERFLSVTATPDRSALFSSAGVLSSGRSSDGGEYSSGIVSGVQPGSAVGHSLNGTAPIVAIDSKIEQAMDLVKTHLMFAVRGEVEHLRSRIMELETTVVHLEAENSILREHVPSNVLQSLSIQSSSTQSTTMT